VANVKVLWRKTMISVPVNEPDGPPNLETKYVFHRASAPKIICWLKGRVRPDKEYPAGIISSIYYDSRGWDFLNEKINSDYLKTKVRLRWYLDFKTETPLGGSYIETKYKIGLRREKIRVLTGLTGKFLETIDLDHPELANLPSKLDGQGGITFKAHMFPVFIVRYHRLRYFDPITGTRISVDYNIHVPKINPRLKLRSNPFKMEQAVLEIKGDACSLPDWLTYLTSMGCRKQSFSKYLAGYQQLVI